MAKIKGWKKYTDNDLKSWGSNYIVIYSNKNLTLDIQKFSNLYQVSLFYNNNGRNEIIFSEEYSTKKAALERAINYMRGK